MIECNMKKGLILDSASFSKFAPETCYNSGFFVKTLKEWDRVLNYLQIKNGLTGLACLLSDEASNTVRNVVFLKPHGMMLLSKYLIENVFCRLGKF